MFFLILLKYGLSGCNQIFQVFVVYVVWRGCRGFNSEWVGIFLFCLVDCGIWGLFGIEYCFEVVIENQYCCI